VPLVHIYLGNVSPLRGGKPIFGLLSKNNTGMAALRADLPVITVSSCLYVVGCLRDLSFPLLAPVLCFQFTSSATVVRRRKVTRR